MSAVWEAVKRSLHCKSNPSDVYEPKTRSRDRNRIRNRNSCCKPNPGASSSSCKSGFNDVINHGCKRFRENPSNCSPLSIRSSDLINPVIHHVRFSNSELNITKHHHQGGGSPGSRLASYFNGGSQPDPVPGSLFRQRPSVLQSGASGSFRLSDCHKCGDPLTRQDSEAHYLSKHAVSEVLEGDSSRKIIEMIYKAGLTTSENRVRVHIERILKVHNPQTKLARFEEYREMVKIRAHRLQHSKKHPRCLADGNELLRFYGTTLACPLGRNGSQNLCILQRCNLCCILRHGFSSKRGLDQSVLLGIYTTSTSDRAYRSIYVEGDERQNRSTGLRKALIVCRVIAGRVHKPMVENSQELVDGGRKSGFDSLARDQMGYNSHIEELYLLNPTALLPCFVIVCK